MAWLEAHQELRDHPKIKRAARALGIARPQMIGHMLCLWWWCLDYAEDGDLSDFDNADIADAAAWEGDPDIFINALVDCGPADRPGLLVSTSDGVTVNDWEEYGGKYITKRNQSRDRQRTYRQRNTPVTQSNASVTRDNSVSNDAREDKIREDKITGEEPEAAATPSADADTIPHSLGGWSDRIRESKNKSAELLTMFKALYPNAVDVPDFGYIGRTAKDVGGAGRLAELLWINSAKPPSGDVMAYIKASAKNSNGRGGYDKDAEWERKKEALYGD